GVSREDAYAIVQRHAMGVWEDLNRGGPDFLTRLKADREVTKALQPAELESLFDLDFHLKHVDTIFARVFGATAPGSRPPAASAVKGHGGGRCSAIKAHQRGRGWTATPRETWRA